VGKGTEKLRNTGRSMRGLEIGWRSFVGMD
jgi:hypothetical protein